jgi:hypothetical protein
MYCQAIEAGWQASQDGEGFGRRETACASRQLMQ